MAELLKSDENMTNEEKKKLVKKLIASVVGIALLVGAEVYRMPHIFGLGKDLTDNKATPVIRVGKFLFAFPYALVLLTEIHSRGFHLVLI